MLRELTTFIKSKQDINNCVIAGDFNKSIKSKTLQEFMIENGLMEIHTFINDPYNQAHDNTYIKGSKYIDTVMAITGLLEFIDRSKLIDFYKVMITDHCGYITDIALEEYFSVEGNYVDELEINRLNS